MMEFFHVCSVAAALDIVETREFYPCNIVPEGGDAGISGFLRGETYRDQILGGRGAEIIIPWQGAFKELIRDGEIIGNYGFPLPRDILCHHKNWRAYIPMRTAPALIGVSDFRVDAVVLNPVTRYRIWTVRQLLKQDKIYIEIKENWPTRPIPRSAWDWLLRRYVVE
jgi:hypothetical protein